MDWITGMQRAIDYIEAHLTDEIDYGAVAAQSFSSSGHFQRLFGALFDCTVGEYIRSRRLSLAGYELASTGAKVIDVALKYGYESPDSFTKAFQRFHGVTPSQARLPGTPLNLYSRLSIRITMEGGQMTNYTIEENPRMILDGIPLELAEPFDFSFLARFGKVFRVFDDLDSGNLCFGMDDGRTRRFVKFAGAKTKYACVPPETAVATLKAAAEIYRDLKHDCLTELLEAGEMGGGYALVYQWTDAACMGKQYPEARIRFLEMPNEDKLRVFADVQRFMAHVIRQGYVAIDFYDGSIMYDFDRKRTVLCDVDFFRRRPAVNDMGRMYGSSRFMSPEEFTLGAPIDERTNVYTLGATAFALFSGSSREREAWPLDEALYQVACRAVSSDRTQRQPSVERFMEEWQGALTI